MTDVTMMGSNDDAGADDGDDGSRQDGTPYSSTTKPSAPLPLPLRGEGRRRLFTVQPTSLLLASSQSSSSKPKTATAAGTTNRDQRRRVTLSIPGESLGRAGSSAAPGRRGTTQSLLRSTSYLGQGLSPEEARAKVKRDATAFLLGIPLRGGSSVLDSRQRGSACSDEGTQQQGSQHKQSKRQRYRMRSDSEYNTGDGDEDDAAAYQSPQQQGRRSMRASLSPRGRGYGGRDDSVNAGYSSDDCPPEHGRRPYNDHNVVHVHDLNAAKPSELVGVRLLMSPFGDASHPFAVCSILPFSAPARKKGRGKAEKKFEVKPMKKTRAFTSALRQDPNHHLHMDLDDPYLLHGKYQNVIQLPSYTVSISRVVTPSELKESLNATFKEKFPNIKLTLSKLRSLKRDMVFIACETECKMDISTVALAHYYFERLVLKGAVTKPTRKLLPACCILLAFKYNSEERPSRVKLQLRPFFKSCEEKWRLSQRDILGMEMRVYAKLGFSLEVDPLTIQAFIKRIISTHPHLEEMLTPHGTTMFAS